MPRRMSARVAAAAGGIKARHGIVPGLAAVLVGDDPASQIYVRSKGKAATAAMANLAEAIHGLVNHMRTEQQMIRDWADSQAEQQRDIKRLLERLGREDVHKV